MNSEWNLARNILCIRLDYLGDVLMCTPAIRALKESMPECRITLLTSESGYAVAHFIPEVDEAIKYAAPWMKSSDRHGAGLDFEMIEGLRSHRFDAAVIFTSYSQSPLPAALLCYFANIPLRLAHCHENPYHLLTDWMPDPEPHESIRHEVRRQLDLVATIGGHTTDQHLSFAVPATDFAWTDDHLRVLGIDPADPWLLFHPGATAPSRRYPSQLWSEVANQLVSHLNCPVVLTGTAEEAPLLTQIQKNIHVPSHSFAGELSLGRFAAMISLVPILISNNTGPAHIAAAVGTPVVDLYALTNPQHTPWQVPSRVLFHDVPCRLCYKSVCPQGHHECLTKVAPERVVKETLELLKKTYRVSGKEDFQTHGHDPSLSLYRRRRNTGTPNESTALLQLSEINGTKAEFT